MNARALAALVILGCAASALAADDVRAFKVFADRTQAYVTLDASARAAIRQGDLFTHDVADEFVKIIRKAFRGKDGKNMRRTIRESDPVRAVTLHATDTYPEDIPTTTMPPTLLDRLPALPKELAYRIIGRALVLQDIRTNVIVDFIPDAIPKA
jgi:hypothetical protein